MNLADIADRLVAKDDKITKGQAKMFADEVFAALKDAAVAGEEVSIPGFGKFKVQDRPARKGRNPATGGTVDIAASRKLSFQASKTLKDALASDAK